MYVAPVIMGRLRLKGDIEDPAAVNSYPTTRCVFSAFQPRNNFTMQWDNVCQWRTEFHHYDGCLCNLLPPFTHTTMQISSGATGICDEGEYAGFHGTLLCIARAFHQAVSWRNAPTAKASLQGLATSEELWRSLLANFCSSSMIF